MNFIHMKASFAIFLSFGLGLGACTESKTQRAESFHPHPSKPVKEVVLDDLKSPWSIAFINDTDALISEKGGPFITCQSHR